MLDENHIEREEKQHTESKITAAKEVVKSPEFLIKLQL
jgi:hypothetical protein